MAFWLRIFCLKATRISRSEISGLFLSAGCLEGALAFTPPPESVESLTEDWRSLLIHHDPNKEPVIIMRESEVRPPPLQKEVTELIANVAQCTVSPGQREITKRLQDAAQVFSIHVEPRDLPQEWWKILDAVETHLARILDGVIYAPAEGFFDSNLREIPLWQADHMHRNSPPVC